MEMWTPRNVRLFAQVHAATPWQRTWVSVSQGTYPWPVSQFTLYPLLELFCPFSSSLMSDIYEKFFTLEALNRDG